MVCLVLINYVLIYVTMVTLPTGAAGCAFLTYATYMKRTNGAVRNGVLICSLVNIWLYVPKSGYDVLHMCLYINVQICL